MGTATLFYLRL